jgi:hypothetical protein
MRVLPRLGALPRRWPWIPVLATVGAWMACWPASADPTRLVPGASPRAELARHAVLSIARDGVLTTMHTRVVAFPTVQDLHADTGAPFAGLLLAGGVRLLGPSAGITLGLVALVGLASTGVGVLAARWWRSAWAGVAAAWVVTTSGPVAVALSDGDADGLLALAIAPWAVICAATALRVDRGRWGAAAGVGLAAALGAGVLHATWLGFGLATLAASAWVEGAAVGGWTRGALAAASGRVIRVVAWCALAGVVIAWGPWLALHAAVGVSPESVGISSVRPPPPGVPYRWFAAGLGTAGAAADAVLRGLSVRPTLVVLAAMALPGTPARRVHVPLAWVAIGWTLALGPSPDEAAHYADPRGYTLLSVLGGAVLAGGGAARLRERLAGWSAVGPGVRGWAASAVTPLVLAGVWGDARPWSGSVPARPGTASVVARAAAAAGGPVLVLPLRPVGDDGDRSGWPTDLVLDQAFHRRPTPLGPAEPGLAGAWPYYEDTWNGGLMRAVSACEGREQEVVVDEAVVEARDRMVRAGLRTVLVDPARVGDSTDGEAWRACIGRLFGEPVGMQGPLQVHRLSDPLPRPID